jgi:hypothetical protein
MADYAQKTRSIHNGTVTSRPSTSARARRTAAPSLHQPAAAGQTLQAALAQGARAQGIAQLRRSIGHSPRVAQLARISAMLQRKSPEEEMPLQGKMSTVQRAGGPKEEKLLQGKFPGHSTNIHFARTSSPAIQAKPAQLGVIQRVVNQATLDAAITQAAANYLAGATDDRQRSYRGTWRSHVPSREAVYNGARAILSAQGIPMGHSDEYELALQADIFEVPTVFG